MLQHRRSLNFVAAAPSHTKAPEYLFMAGRYLERAGKLVEAAETWERLGDEYANSNQAFNAYFFAGICYYRLADYPNAEIDFKQSLTLTGDPTILLLRTCGSAKRWLPRADPKMRLRFGSKLPPLTPPVTTANAPVTCCLTGNLSPRLRRPTWDLTCKPRKVKPRAG